MTCNLLLRARVVLPVAQPPFEDGAVLIRRRRIVWVGPDRAVPAAARRHTRAVDLGDSLLLPGLVNAHCHLDYTHMAGQVPPQKSFVDWIKLITTAKAEWTTADFAQSWLDGARMLLHTGTTTVADFEAAPELLPQLWTRTPLRVLSFLEMTGVKSRRDPRAVLNQTLARIRSLPAGRSRALLAPHAPYSTVPALLRLAAAAARRRRWPMSVHVAESAEELDMLRHGRGAMFDWLRRNERDMADCGRATPVRHLADCGMLGKNLVAVHANYLEPGDIQLFKRNGVSVVHCPRSHFYFRHHPFPFQRLRKARINICLGTDSLATVYRRRKETVTLSLFEEMQAFAAAHPRLARNHIIAMVTRNAARALGFAGRLGELTPGALADLIVLPYHGSAADAAEAAVGHQGNVSASMIDGQWVLPP